MYVLIDTCVVPELIVHQVFRLGDAEQSNYSVRWPIRGGRYNHADYSSRGEVLGDIETILLHALRKELDFELKTSKVS